jgi:predicted nucleic acid-binding protein
MTTMDDNAVIVDTNVLLSATAPLRPLHRAALAVLNDWPNQGIPLTASRQILREYLAVATRPVEANGLNLGTSEALANIKAFRGRIRLLAEWRRGLGSPADPGHKLRLQGQEDPRRQCRRIGARRRGSQSGHSQRSRFHPLRGRARGDRPDGSLAAAVPPEVLAALAGRVLTEERLYAASWDHSGLRIGV